MKKTAIILILLVCAFSFVCGASVFAAPGKDSEGRAKIGLKPDGDASYISNNGDAWFTDSWVSNSLDFTLGVTSLTKSASIYDAHLVLAIPYDTSNSDWSFTLGNTTFEYGDFTNSGEHPYLPPHGVFLKKDGALWTEYSLGTILAGQTVNVPFNGEDMPHGMLVHFDAYGSNVDGTQTGWYRNAFSHDVTVTPEPISSILFLTGTGVLIGRRFVERKKRA